MKLQSLLFHISRLEPRSPSYQTDSSVLLFQEMNQSSDSNEMDSPLESDLSELIAGIERANFISDERDGELTRAQGSETALRMSREELENVDIDALLSPIQQTPITEELPVIYIQSTPLNRVTFGRIGIALTHRS